VRNQITVRDLDPEAERRVRELARRKRISLNKAAGMLIRKGAGLAEDHDGPETVGSALDAFIGSWSREDEVRLLASIENLGRVDTKLWE
jgi:hypothetical protein